MVVTTLIARATTTLKARMTMELVRAMVAMVMIQVGLIAFLKVERWSYTMTSGVTTTSAHALSLSYDTSTAG
jgi:hypothetical protein